jgi:hypothetical protein
VGGRKGSVRVQIAPEIAPPSALPTLYTARYRERRMAVCWCCPVRGEVSLRKGKKIEEVYEPAVWMRACAG